MSDAKSNTNSEFEDTGDDDKQNVSDLFSAILATEAKIEQRNCSNKKKDNKSNL